VAIAQFSTVRSAAIRRRRQQQDFPQGSRPEAAEGGVNPRTKKRPARLRADRFVRRYTDGDLMRNLEKG